MSFFSPGRRSIVRFAAQVALPAGLVPRGYNFTASLLASEMAALHAFPLRSTLLSNYSLSFAICSPG